MLLGVSIPNNIRYVNQLINFIACVMFLSIRLLIEKNELMMTEFADIIIWIMLFFFIFSDDESDAQKPHIRNVLTDKEK